MCWRVPYCILLVSLCAQARAQGQCSDPSFYTNASGACVPCLYTNEVASAVGDSCQCAASFWRADETSPCEMCPLGSESTSGKNHGVYTCKCPNGAYGFIIEPFPPHRNTRQIVCSRCGPNMYGDPNAFCFACPGNSILRLSYSTSKHNCEGNGYCRANAYWYAQWDRCRACPEHSTNPETSGTAQAATVCLCDAGHRSEVDASGVQTCVACAPGTYAAADGANACTACANGTSAAGTAATACAPCAAGWHTQAPGASACLQDPVPTSPAPAAHTPTPKAGTAETVENGKTGKAGGVSAGILLAILLPVCVCIALFPKLLTWVQGQQLARVRAAEVPFAAVLPGPGQPYLLVRA